MSKYQKGGSINESGTLNNLTKKGYTYNQCMCEIIANSIDANCSNCVIKIGTDFIKIIDDGNGMDIEGLYNMWDLNRESHRDEEKIGICGVGAKASLLLLSKKRECFVYTKTKKGTYLKTTVDWEKIFKEKKLSGMIEFDDMNEKEIKIFNEERNLVNKGTSIYIPYDEELENIIQDQFDLNESKNIIPKERFGIIFGYIRNFTLELFHVDHPDEKKEIKYYRPFLRKNINFYDGKTEHIIKVIEDEDGEINYFTQEPETEKLIYCRKTRRGVDKNISEYKKNIRDKELGEFILQIGMHKDLDYFNPENPEILTDSNTTLLEWEVDFFGDDKSKKEFIASVPIVRNNHFIGSFALDKFTSMEGGGSSHIETKFKNWRTRCGLSYKTNSTQDNKIDDLVKIQENKQQYNSNNLDKKILNLIIYLRNKKCDSLKKYRDNLVDISKKKNLKNEDKFKKKYIFENKLFSKFPKEQYIHLTFSDLEKYLLDKKKTYDEMIKSEILGLFPDVKYEELSFDELDDKILELETLQKERENLLSHEVFKTFLGNLDELSNIKLKEIINQEKIKSEKKEEIERKKIYKEDLLRDKILGCIPYTEYENLNTEELEKFISAKEDAYVNQLLDLFNKIKENISEKSIIKIKQKLVNKI